MGDGGNAAANGQQPKKILERSFDWFVLGVGVAVVVGTIGALAWLEGFVDKRIAVNMPETNGVTEARVNELIDAIPQRTIPSPEQIDERIDTKLRGIALPTGTVMAFDRDSGCPAGWTLFEPAISRVIVGAVASRSASAPTRDENGKLLTARQYRADGGVEQHTLTVAQMPSHAHKIGKTPDAAAPGLETLLTRGRLRA